MQILWLLRLALPDDRTLAIVSFFVARPCRAGHPDVGRAGDAAASSSIAGHLAERFGLFTIIVLGEVILSSTVAVREAIDAVGIELDVLVVAAAALVIAFAVWWSYFGRDDEPEVDRLNGAFFWGYGHLPVYAGWRPSAPECTSPSMPLAGVEHVTDRVAALAVTIPLAVAIVGFTISVANARSERERRLLRRWQLVVVSSLPSGSSPRCTWRSSARRSLFVAGTIVQGIVLERRLGCGRRREQRCRRRRDRSRRCAPASPRW